MKRKLLAETRKIKYRDLLKQAVYDNDKEPCMLKQCTDYHAQTGVVNALDHLIEEHEINWVAKKDYMQVLDRRGKLSLSSTYSLGNVKLQKKLM